jgi:nitrogen fixation-related uncharacterized protein
VPYNVRELFINHANAPALICFALALLWIGGGAMLLAYVIARMPRAYLMMPVALILGALISKLLLFWSVTDESIDDIVGVNTLFGWVTVETIWGAAWKRLFESVGKETVGVIERGVRYVALYSLPMLAIGLVLAVVARSRRPTLRAQPRDRWLLVLIAAAWFWLARAIVVPWAATDNLTELLARRPLFGIPGEWYLMPIPVLIGASVAMLISATARPRLWPLAVASTVATVPISWALLNLGLEPHVEKYGLVFSGAQFLLGPDRQTTLSESALFARWALVQVGAVAVTFIGAWIVHRLVLSARRE